MSFIQDEAVVKTGQIVLIKQHEQLNQIHDMEDHIMFITNSQMVPLYQYYALIMLGTPFLEGPSAD